MTESLRDEHTYDHDRLERRVHAKQRETGLSRRQVLTLLSVGAGAASIASMGGWPSLVLGQSAPPTTLKPLPLDKFRILGTNAETLWEAYQGVGYLTPKELFFVRNHTRTPVIDAETWRLTVGGSGVKHALSLRYEDLLKLPATHATKAIECAGNGRSFFGTQQGTPATGTQWRLGAIGVGRWKGVRLSHVLDLAGLKPTAIDVEPQGLDPEVATTGHVRRAISIDKALDDVLLVYELNGEPLPPDHGFPVRVLVPGWIGVANVKWVGHIEVSETPLTSAWNTTQYRLFGSAYPDSPVLSTQTVKSAIELPFPATLQRGWQLINGRAWSAHGAIRKVEVNFDGERWWPAFVNPLKNVPQAWAQWSFLWPAKPGAYVLKVRATDTRGNMQPTTVVNNTQGYLFNGIVDHPVMVT